MKDYIRWNEIKKNIENTGKEQKFRDGEIWWCSLGENIGFEEDGKHENFERPILILRKFNKFIFLGLPLTSQKHKDIFHSSFSIKILNKLGDLVEEKESFAILSQARLLSSKRMIRRVVKINDKTFNKIKQDFVNLLNIKRNGPLSGSSGA
jgi:mRNA interferase MazF